MIEYCEQLKVLDDSVQAEAYRSGLITKLSEKFKDDPRYFDKKKTFPDLSVLVYGKIVLAVVQRQKNLKKIEEMARNRKERKEVDPEIEGKDLAQGRGEDEFITPRF